MKRGKTNAKREPLAVVVEPVVRFVRCEICGTTIHSDETNTVDVEEHDGSHFTIEVCDKCDADCTNVRIVAPFGTVSFNKPNPTGHAPARSAAEGR